MDNRFNGNEPVTRSRVYGQAGLDIGLRTYMLKVYNLMAMALLLTGLVAFVASSSPQFMLAIFGTPLKWVVIFAPLAVVLLLSFKIDTLSYATAQTIFWAYAGLMGLSLSTLFVIYTGESITRVFFITASTFGAMSLYGYTTKRDLSGFGSFLFMGLIGIIIASIVNIFLQSSAMQFVISIISVLVFTGLTAYDTQAIKDRYYQSAGQEQLSKIALMGALELYLDFINLFISLLRIFGDRR